MTTIEKIRQEIERRIKLYSVTNEKEQWIVNTYWSVLSYLDTIQVDEPEGLDEAAEEYEDWVESYSQSDFPTCVSFKQAFTAGAKWAMDQGVSITGKIGIRGIEADGIIDALFSAEPPFNYGDEVIVQIRKKL